MLLETQFFDKLVHNFVLELDVAELNCRFLWDEIHLSFSFLLKYKVKIDLTLKNIHVPLLEA
jgi:hypothetical protein